MQLSFVSNYGTILCKESRKWEKERNTVKRFVALFLAFVLIVALCGCGQTSKNSISPNTGSASEIATEATKFAYTLYFPSYSMYYLFDSETKTATTFTYYKEDNVVLDIITGEYSGTLSNDGTVEVSFTDGVKPWTERVVFDSKMSSIRVLIIGTVSEVEYTATDVKKVMTILEMYRVK